VHQVIQPKIHYYGTPVVLLSTLNEDGIANLAPMSSAWWLGQSCLLGLSTRGQTFANLRRQGEVVLNLASSDLVAAVNRLALTTGMNPVPGYKQAIGTEYVKDKFGRAGLTPLPSDLVGPPRVQECQISLEAKVRRVNEVGAPEQFLASIEVEILRVHCEEKLLTPGKRHYIDPDQWKPLIMSFLEFYSLGDGLHDSRLAKVF
jgi:flavin reductase (DIM6/NTAB) family NADH-FMN oxidoreductase RutF